MQSNMVSTSGPIPRLTPEQLFVAGSLLVVALVSWWITVVQQSTMMDSGMFSLEPIALILFVSSWTIGMVAMMFPTTVPMMLMFFHVGRAATPEIRAGGGPTVTKAALFIASYIALWAAVGVLIYLAIGAANAIFPASALSELVSSPLGIGMASLIVGFYQLSPIKGECLDKCHPTNFLFKYYRGGRVGAVKMGILYAKYCVGCCWVMMVFLLLVATMGVLWMAVFAGLIFIERAIVHGKWPSRLIGIAFLSAGGIRLIIP